ncbi:hypothetical protein SK128_015435 [Halocaridina rubra]|uniref:Uncharacterized protein n=1 Tax=Halocaridina rubra TaxID=373956 RepID=A0AAN8WFX1_HALRR
MSCHLLKCLDLSKDDEECSEDIESCEEESANSPNASGNLDSAIEECEESPQLAKTQDSRNSYTPLDVKKKRMPTTLTVNSERTISLQRKTVLYGQTPKAICRHQLQDLAEWNGMSVEEFVKKILAGSSLDNLRYLRQFHTCKEPSLSLLFDELEGCNLGNIDMSGTNKSRRVHAQLSCVDNLIRFDISNSRPVQAQKRNTDNLDTPCPSNPRPSHSHLHYTDNVDKPLTSNSRFAHTQKGTSESNFALRKQELAKGCANSKTFAPENEDIFPETEANYFHIPTVPAHELHFPRRKAMKRLTNKPNQLASKYAKRTVIPESDNDSDSDDSVRVLSSNSESKESKNYITDIPSIHAENDSSSVSNLYQSSASSDVFDPLIRSEIREAMIITVPDSDCKDHNSFLDGLLFDEHHLIGAPMSSSAAYLGRVSNKSNDMERSSIIYSGNNIAKAHRHDLSQNCDYEKNRSIYNCDKNTSRLVRQSSSCYNRILDRMLCDESSDADPSSDSNIGNIERYDIVKNNQPTLSSSNFDYDKVEYPSRANIDGGLCNEPRTTSSESRYKSVLTDLLDSSPDISSGESSKENLSPLSRRILSSVERIETSRSSANIDKCTPSSQELYSSLWHTLDKSLEY